MNLKIIKKYIKSAITFFILILLSSMLLTSCEKKVAVNLYFGKISETETYLESDTRMISESNDFYKDVVTEIIKGPEKEGLYRTIPSSVIVNSVTLENRMATVDLSGEIITDNTDIPHSSTTEMLAIYSIVNTLTEFEDIDEVRITVEGMTSGELDGLAVEDFWGHIGIHDKFIRNEEIIAQ